MLQLHCWQCGLVTRVEALSVSETACTDPCPASRVWRDIVNDIVRASRGPADPDGADNFTTAVKRQAIKTEGVCSIGFLGRYSPTARPLCAAVAARKCDGTYHAITIDDGVQLYRAGYPVLNFFLGTVYRRGQRASYGGRRHRYGRDRHLHF